MVTPNPDKHAWWIKDSYTREEIDQLVQWGDSSTSGYTATRWRT